MSSNELNKDGNKFSIKLNEDTSKIGYSKTEILTEDLLKEQLNFYIKKYDEIINDKIDKNKITNLNKKTKNKTKIRFARSKLSLAFNRIILRLYRAFYSVYPVYRHVLFPYSHRAAYFVIQ